MRAAVSSLTAVRRSKLKYKCVTCRFANEWLA